MRWMMLGLGLVACSSVATVDEPLPDFDGDGIPDVEDDDADGDGIPDVDDPFVDLDSDGFDRREDCDDADPAVNPGAEEICGNGKDDNCDGGAPECRFVEDVPIRTVSAGIYAGEEATDGLGVGLDFLGGDVEGDGFEDLVVAASNVGLAYRFAGDADGNSSARRAATTYFGDGPTFGQTVAAGDDLDGDGVLDVVLCEPGFSDSRRSGIGRADIRAATTSTSEARAVLGGAAFDALGAAAHVEGDIDGNGRGDLWLSVSDSPALVVVPDRIERAEVSFSVSSAGTLSLPASGDIDGDGRADLVFQRDRAKGVLFLSASPGRYGEGDADALLLGGGNIRSGRLRTGGLDVGDLDGDGYDDIALTYGSVLRSTDDEGDVKLVRGSAEGMEDEQVDGSIDATFGAGALGAGLQLADLDGDQRDDLVLVVEQEDLAIYYDLALDGSSRSMLDWDARLDANTPLSSFDIADTRNADGSLSIAAGFTSGAGAVFLIRLETL